MSVHFPPPTTGIEGDADVVGITEKIGITEKTQATTTAKSRAWIRDAVAPKPQPIATKEKEVSSPQAPDAQQKRNSLIKAVLMSRGVTAIVVGLVSAIILVSINPPIVQQKSKQEGGQESDGDRSAQKVAVISVIAAAVAFLLPYCMSWATAHKPSVIAVTR